MRRHVTCAGFHITREEWDELDDLSRLHLLQAMAETRQRPDDGAYYELYELRVEPPAPRPL